MLASMTVVAAVLMSSFVNLPDSSGLLLVYPFVHQSRVSKKRQFSYMS